MSNSNLKTKLKDIMEKIEKLQDEVNKIHNQINNTDEVSNNKKTKTTKTKTKKAKSGNVSSWIQHVKDYASKNNMKYPEALKDPNCKKEYKN